MGTLEKSSENHEIETVKKRFAKQRDFYFRTAPDHGKEALWPRTRKLVDFGPKTVRIGPKSARMNACWCQSLPCSLKNRVQKMAKTVKSGNFVENPRWGPYKNHKNITENQ